jgi:ADP-heptose:LPS heptosyltransferase
MQSFGNIVVFHPAAIGDAMLASPVATTLKLNFPGAKLTYWTHAGLRPILLGLCPAIDEVVDYVRDANLFQQAKTFESLRPDLFVDLAASTKSHAMTWLSRVKVLRYDKNPAQHAVDNFLNTIRPVCNEFPDPLFPTIFPEALVEHVLEPFFEPGQHRSVPYIGIVPGVGKLRPHRAWLHDCWLYLLEHILGWGTHLPVLIGGSDESEMCAQLNESVGGRALNTAGKLSLPEAAAVLKQCEVVVSGDTGPAHLAVAVGTKVVGLYGATYASRSGPFGCEDLVLDQSAACQCHGNKSCQFTQPGSPGDCMRRIMLVEVIEKLKYALHGEIPEHE